jgi:hypothetical protein
MDTNFRQVSRQDQVVLRLSIGLGEIFSLIDQLGPAERLLVSRHLDQTWADQFEVLLNRIQARVPPEISEEEVLRDVAEAVREVRSSSAWV